MLDNESRNRGDQRSGVQTTIGTTVDNGNNDNNNGNGRRRRSVNSSSHVASSAAVAVSQADFEGKFFRNMFEHRIAIGKNLLRKKFRDFARKWQKECETNTAGVSKQVETKKTELLSLYRLYLSDRGVSPGPLSTSNTYIC